MESRIDQNQISPLMNLPDPLLAHVFSFLSPEALLLVALASRRSKQFSRDESLWRDKIRQYFFESAPHAVQFQYFWEMNKSQSVKKRNATQEQLEFFSWIQKRKTGEFIAKNLTLKNFLARNILGYSILFWARKTRNQSLLDHVYQLACQQYKEEEKDKDILLLGIACLQSIEKIFSLLKQGNHFDERYFDSKCSLLHMAAKVNHLRLVQKLLDGKNDVAQLQQVSQDGETPLMYAAMTGSEEVMTFLLQKIDQVEKANSLEKGSLLQVKSDVKAGEKQAIHYASTEGNVAVVEMLIKQHPSLLNEKDAHGLTPLFSAVVSGRREIVTFLLAQKNLEIDAFSEIRSENDVENSRTALHWAAMKGDLSLCEALLKKGASLRAETKPSKNMPIHIAVKNGHLKLVEYFIQQDPALVNEGEKPAKPPIVCAIDKGHIEIIEFLLSQKNIELINHPSYGDVFLYATMCAAKRNETLVCFFQGNVEPTKPFDKCYQYDALSEKTKVQYQLMDYIKQTRIELEQLSFHPDSYKPKFFQKNLQERKTDLAEELKAASALKKVIIDYRQDIKLQDYFERLNKGTLKELCKQAIEEGLLTKDAYLKKEGLK